MWNGTMFVDLDWPLNASSLLSASAELLVFESVLMLYAKIIKSVLVKTILFYLVAGKKPVAIK